MRSMVCSGERKMAMGPERSKPLHNFKLPCLKWGNQRYLRCMKLDNASTATDSSSAGADHHLHSRRHVIQRRRSPLSKFESLIIGGMRRQESESCPTNNMNYDYRSEQQWSVSKGEAAEGIEAVREKIIKDLKTAADNIMDAIFRDEVSDDDDVNDDEDEFQEPKQKVKEKKKKKFKEKEREESPAVEVEARPWNLRTRRAACKAPIVEGVTNNYHRSPLKNEVIKSPRVRDAEPLVAPGAAAAEKKTPRQKFSVPLSKKEIEQDFMVMAGHRPPTRPKKRARYVQKQLDSLFPGLWLTEVKVDSYKVSEFVENGKR